MRIYLTGFMGSGKSTVGPNVAARLGCTFLDLDRLIAVNDGRSIRQIFSEDGEERFRKIETAALHETANRNNLVVALGGGALVNDENRAFAKEHGHVIYLEVDPDTILDRVADEADRRPLLQDEEGAPLPGRRMRERIERMLEERASAYADAHATVDGSSSVSSVVDAVTSTIRENEWDE